MKSLKTYFALTALVFSLSAVADRSRDTGHKGSHSKQSSDQHNAGKKHQNKAGKKSYQRQSNAKKVVRGNNHAYKGHGRNGNNNHRNNGPKGFSGDYRNNRHFDNSNRRHNSYGHNGRNHGHNNHNRGAIRHNYYKPKKYYSKWKKQNHRLWKNKYRHFNKYQVYTSDLYRYRPLRGLGHYFDRPGYGYGHWHEGGWCASHHSESYYRNYYSAYPYRDGWRRGDGDFGIWFSFNL